MLECPECGYYLNKNIIDDGGIVEQCDCCGYEAVYYPDLADYELIPQPGSCSDDQPAKFWDMEF